jgi:hypothetical protein
LLASTVLTVAEHMAGDNEQSAGRDGSGDRAARLLARPPAVARRRERPARCWLRASSRRSSFGTFAGPGRQLLSAPRSPPPTTPSSRLSAGSRAGPGLPGHTHTLLPQMRELLTEILAEHAAPPRPPPRGSDLEFPRFGVLEYFLTRGNESLSSTSSVRQCAHLTRRRYTSSVQRA